MKIVAMLFTNVCAVLALVSGVLALIARMSKDARPVGDQNQRGL
jgi:hypothetical protein